MPDINIENSRVATFMHTTMTRSAFRTHIAQTFGHRGVRGLNLKAPYDQVEYLSSPFGLIVLAHHANVAGQVDGIHPVSLSDSVRGNQSIVEQLGKSGGNYAVHYLPRRWQGQLVMAAFGRMVDSGEPEAPALAAEGKPFALEIFDAPSGPIVGVIDGDQVHVIQAHIGNNPAEAA